MSFHTLTTMYKQAILPAITYASESWSIALSIRAKCKLPQIQRCFLIFITKAYRTVSHEALSAIAGSMPLEQKMHLYKDIGAMSRGQPTNAITPQLKKVETPIKIKGIHPTDNHIIVDLSGTQGNAIVTIYTDGSKTEKHVGASMAAITDCTEIHTETQKLNKSCTHFSS